MTRVIGQANPDWAMGNDGDSTPVDPGAFSAADRQELLGSFTLPGRIALLIQRALFALSKSETELAAERRRVDELVASMTSTPHSWQSSNRVSLALEAVRASRAKRGTE